MYLGCSTFIIIINIIIIFRHELRFDRPISAPSDGLFKVFRVVCVHLVYNSALFLLSSCCLFLLYVVTILIYIF